MKAEFNVRPFRPGERFNFQRVPQMSQPCKVQFGQAVASVPLRLHFSLIDYDFMSLYQPGGGGVGVSFDGVRLGATVTARSDGQICSTGASPAAQHMAKLFLLATSARHYGLTLQITNVPGAEHMGLGSSIAGNIAILSALNTLFGSPLSWRGIFDIATTNYVESVDGTYVSAGFDTGVGAAALLCGGYVLVDESCTTVETISTSHVNLHAVVMLPNREKIALKRYQELGIGVLGETAALEVVTNEEFGKVHQQMYGEELKAYLGSVLRPAFEMHSLSKLHDNLRTLNKIGTFKRMQQSYDSDVLLDFENFAYNSGAIYAGITSAGPSLFAITPRRETAEDIQMNLERRYKYLYLSSSVGRIGLPAHVKVDKSLSKSDHDYSDL